jgi:hypothetical protein
MREESKLISVLALAQCKNVVQEGRSVIGIQI